MKKTLNGQQLKEVFADHKLLNALRIFLGLAIINYVQNRVYYNWNADSHALFYFTIQSNILCAAYWLLSWIPAVRRNNILVLAVTLYISITGIVFITLLDIPFTDKLYELLSSGKITAEVHYFSSITSTGTHYIIPFCALIDFLIFIEIKDMKLSSIWKILIYPLVYFIFHLILSFTTGVFIYPFLDPSVVGSWFMVGLVAIAALALFVFLGWVLIKLNVLVQNRMTTYYDQVLAELAQVAETTEP
jgi:hypothetical protein